MPQPRDHQSRAPPTVCNSTRASASPTLRRSRPIWRGSAISHVYASPWLKARPGSTHGYDIVDHQPAQSGARRRSRFPAPWSRRSASNGLGQILDFVPNHMGVGGADNPWWLDVLEWGHGFRIRRLVRHRLGARSPLPAGQAAGAVPWRSVWRGAGSRQARSALRRGHGAASPSGLTIRTSCRSVRCTMSASWAMSIPNSSASAMRSPACPIGGRACRPRPRAAGRAGEPGDASSEDVRAGDRWRRVASA